MFQLVLKEDKEYNTYDVSLKYSDDRISLTLEPEYPECIVDVNLDTDCRLDSSPSNGEFYLAWDSKSIFLSVAKYGDGQGGSLTVTINRTPEVMASLMKCLKEWQDVFTK